MHICLDVQVPHDRGISLLHLLGKETRDRGADASSCADSTSGESGWVEEGREVTVAFFASIVFLREPKKKGGGRRERERECVCVI